MAVFGVGLAVPVRHYIQIGLGKAERVAAPDTTSAGHRWTVAEHSFLSLEVRCKNFQHLLGRCQVRQTAGSGIC